MYISVHSCAVAARAEGKISAYWPLTPCNNQIALNVLFDALSRPKAAVEGAQNFSAVRGHC